MKVNCPRCRSQLTLIDGSTCTTGFPDTVNQTLNDELVRVRSVQVNAAHALDTLRQHFGLDLIEGEHPMDTAKRIRESFIGEANGN